MICPACQKDTELGRFCTNCGSALSIEEEVAASGDTVFVTEMELVESEQTTSGRNRITIDTSEKIKQAASGFANFFLRLLKSPSDAKKMKGNEYISGIISVVLFVLIFSTSTYITLSSSYFGASFIEGFIAPFLRLLILFAVMIGLTYGGSKMAAQSNSITGITAKFGAYLVPFFALAVVGMFLALIQLPFSGILIILGLVAPVLLIPTFILLEETINGFDTIYVLIGIYIVGVIISGYIIQNMIGAFLGNFMGIF